MFLTEVLPVPQPPCNAITRESLPSQARMLAASRAANADRPRTSARADSIGRSEENQCSFRLGLGFFAAFLAQPPLGSLHSHRLEHRVHGVGVEAGLELGEQLAGYGRDVGHAGH